MTDYLQPPTIANESIDLRVLKDKLLSDDILNNHHLYNPISVDGSEDRSSYMDNHELLVYATPWNRKGTNYNN